jgi:hypothetical protein
MMPQSSDRSGRSRSYVIEDYALRARAAWRCPEVHSLFVISRRASYFIGRGHGDRGELRSGKKLSITTYQTLARNSKRNSTLHDENQQCYFHRTNTQSTPPYSSTYPLPPSYSDNSRTILRSPFPDASRDGVRPSTSRTWTCAPRSSNNLTTLMRPFHDAICNGVDSS